MIKAFLFDNGGVITAGGKGLEISDRLAKNLGISSDESYNLLSPFWSAYTDGKLSDEELWSNIEFLYGQPIAVELRDIWNTWEYMQPVPAMIDLVHQLKSKGYKVGMVSNVFPYTEREIRAHGGYDEFDFTILSCKVGVSKPDPNIYDLAMEQLIGIQPSEVVFLDDQERCLVPAKAMGMTTLLVDDLEEAVGKAKALINL